METNIQWPPYIVKTEDSKAKFSGFFPEDKFDDFFNFMEEKLYNKFVIKRTAVYNKGDRKIFHGLTDDDFGQYLTTKLKNLQYCCSKSSVNSYKKASRNESCEHDYTPPIKEPKVTRTTKTDCPARLNLTRIVQYTDYETKNLSKYGLQKITKELKLKLDNEQLHCRNLYYLELIGTHNHQSSASDIEYNKLRKQVNSELKSQISQGIRSQQALKQTLTNFINEKTRHSKYIELQKIQPSKQRINNEINKYYNRVGSNVKSTEAPLKRGYSIIWPTAYQRKLPSRVDKMADTKNIEPSPKKIKVCDDASDNKNGNNVTPKFVSLKDFEIEKILNNNPDRMSVAVMGKFKGIDDTAVVHLQKCPFKDDDLKDILSEKTSLEAIFNNDIYYNQTAFIPNKLNGVQLTAVYPAEDKHINKYTPKQMCFIEETPDIYKSVTLPFIENSSYSKQWIYNILEHKKESERIVCEDLDPINGFVMVPDMKWCGEDKQNLYLMAIVMRRDIRSIRDLTDEHLPLLINMRDKCTNTIKEKYGVPSEDLRIYFHYQPSFYHLHLHFTALTYEAPGSWIGKAYLLSTVINNLKISPDYYKKSTLSFAIQKNHLLYKNLEETGYFDDKDGEV